MRISALEGCGVALWGWGRESRAAYRAFRATFPKQPLTLFCTMAEALDVQALADPTLCIETEVSVSRLAAVDVVIKSPGISPY
ncbi:MAG TPA: UDP-N-acetylmuramoyl-L-alanine--D-glutamate ligase, partial [Xylella taiwanensis]